MQKLPRIDTRHCAGAGTAEGCLAAVFLAAVFVTLVLACGKAVFRRCAVPRGHALRSTSLRNLCLLRTERLAAWPSLAPAFEAARTDWLKQQSIVTSFCKDVEVQTTHMPPKVLVDRPETKLSELGGSPEATILAWEILEYCNVMFFENELLIDELSFLPECQGSELEEEGAEAWLCCKFNGNLTKALLRIEISFGRAQHWTISRLASVLLHELVHAWHDSVHWPGVDQLCVPHSADFLRKCEVIGGLCEAQDLAFFPNVFTESWVLLATRDLGLLVTTPNISEAAWIDHLSRCEPFSGSLLEDLKALGVAEKQARAIRQRLNNSHIRQALRFGYQKLQVWRSRASRACLEHLASWDGSSMPDVMVRSDYLVAPLPFLAGVSRAEGLPEEICWNT